MDAPQKKNVSLIDRFVETMPDANDRPIRENAAVRDEAVSRIAPLLKHWAPDKDEAFLAKALELAARWTTVPAEIAKNISQKLKIPADQHLHDALAQYPIELDMAHEKMVKAWVRKRGMVAKWSRKAEVVGTIRVNRYAYRSIPGTITDIDEDLAIYTLMSIENGKRTWHKVPFEFTAGREEKPAVDEEINLMERMGDAD